MALKRSGLGPKGKGLEALFEQKKEEFESTASNEAVMLIDINKIEPNKSQPRKNFSESSLEELAQSIKQYGVIQPIIVKKSSGGYELVAGERRWRASKIAGIKEIPAIIKDYDEDKLFEIALVENLQREDLNPIEEAMGYSKLSDNFGLSQEEISKRVGKSRSAVANSIRLLSLDDNTQALVKSGKLSAGHARTIIPVDDEKQRLELAERIIEEELSVRETENIVKKILENKKEKKTKQKLSKFNTDSYGKIEENLKNILGANVKLKSGKNKGAIEIEYYSDDDLERLMALLGSINI